MSQARSNRKGGEVKGSRDFVTFLIADQLFGIPVSEVQDVFSPQAITRVPLAPPEIGGVLNLRGRIVTAIDVRQRLGLPPRNEGAIAMAVGIEKGGESYGLIIDRVGEVLSLDETQFERNPANLSGRWREISRGVFRLDQQILVVLDIDLILNLQAAVVAA